MTILYLIIVLFFSVLFTSQVLHILIFALKSIKGKKTLSEMPPVSILIAARNEETNILDCLKAIHRLSYPKELIQVLIGDDASTDRTMEIVKEYIADKPNFSLISVKQNLGSAQGKANVLAHLAKEANTDYFFITDADIEVPLDWVQSMLEEMDEGVGIVSGCTMVRGEGLFAKYQSVEWLYAFSLVHLVSRFNCPVSAVGNNMVIRKEAYLSTGGYENIPFSIIEDLELFKHTVAKGWKFKNLFNRKVLAYSKPAESLYKLLQQRKRWMRGAVQLNWFIILVLGVQSSFLAFFPLALIVDPVLALSLWLIKFVLQSIYQLMIFNSLKKMDYLKYIFVFEGYSIFMNALILIFFNLPIKVEWKERQYD